MSYRSNVTYVYDSSFTGLLCVIFDSFNRLEIPDEIFTYETESLTLFELHEVESDDLKADRVAKWLKSISYEAYALVYHAYLSCLEKKEIYILLFTLKLRREGKTALSDLSDSTVSTLVKAVKSLYNESHLFKGFVRFTEISCVLVSEIKPKAIVLPLILKHFEFRFPNERYIIIDRSHKSMLIHDKNGSQISDYTEFELPADTPNEAMIKNLWIGFYDTIAIEERKNLKCRMGHMPKRYWECMTEMHDLYNSPSERPISEGLKAEQLK